MAESSEHRNDPLELYKYTSIQVGNIMDNYQLVTMALGLTQPLTKMSTRNISLGIKAAGA